MQVNRRRALLMLLSLIGVFVITRSVLHVMPNIDLNVGSYNIHHLFSGVILITLCGIAVSLVHSNSRMADLATVGFGAGLGLVLDEWVYLIVTDGSNAAYLSPISFWGAVTMVGLASLYISLLYLLARR